MWSTAILALRVDEDSSTWMSSRAPITVTAASRSGFSLRWSAPRSRTTGLPRNCASASVRLQVKAVDVHLERELRGDQVAQERVVDRDRDVVEREHRLARLEPRHDLADPLDLALQHDLLGAQVSAALELAAAGGGDEGRTGTSARRRHTGCHGNLLGPNAAATVGIRGPALAPAGPVNVPRRRVKRRVIRVLTVQNPILYFVDRGREVGMTYESIKGSRSSSTTSWATRW